MLADQLVQSGSDVLAGTAVLEHLTDPADDLADDLWRVRDEAGIERNAIQLHLLAQAGQGDPAKIEEQHIALWSRRHGQGRDDRCIGAGCSLDVLN